MGMLKEFKEFAVRGNVIDLAVGVIIGGAFGKIVSSFVNDVVMPPIGLLVGGVDFKDLAWTLKDAELDASGETIAAAVTVNYGMFIQNVVDFIIVAFVIFLAVKGINKMNKKEEKKAEAAPPPPPPKSEVLLEEIRDLLKKQ
ncbi:large-conductance mechanosensitive channel protein MscL [Algoriphagus kandeliae]|nr:large-conductance mechanosensitive channel protein MscL [Algoriphagus kandeliae]